MNKGKEKFIQKEMIKEFTEKVALNKVTRFLSHPERYLGQRYIKEWNNINSKN